MAKKSAKQKQTNRNRKQQKRKIKTLARAKQKYKVKVKPNNSKMAGEFKFDDIFLQEKLDRNNSEHQQSIKTTFSEILEEYSKIDTASIFSSLLLNPNYQSSQYRLEKAISICLSFCDGNKKPDLGLIKFIFKKLDKLGLGHMEDPAEDVFISTIWFEEKQYKLSTGLWEGGIYQAQIFLSFIEEAPDNDKNLFIKNRLQAILKASDLIITKAELSINEVGAKYPIEDINYVVLNNSSTAVNIINKIKPDFFCKGPDKKNQKDDITGQIKNEISAVKKHGSLTIKEGQLVNQHHQAISLAGPSLYFPFGSFSKYP